MLAAPVDAARNLRVRKDQIELQVRRWASRSRRRWESPPRRADPDRPRPGRSWSSRSRSRPPRACPVQAERLAAVLVEVAEDAGRNGQIEPQRRRHLRQPAEIDVAVVQLRRQIGVLRPLQIMHGKAGRNHQRRIARRTGQGEDRLQLDDRSCPCRRCRPAPATWRRRASSETRRCARPAESAARPARAWPAPRRRRPALAESGTTSRDATPVAPAASASGGTTAGRRMTWAWRKQHAA